MKIFIPGNVPSLKNQKMAVPGKGVFHSKTVYKYLRSLGIQGYSLRNKTVKGYKKTPNMFWFHTADAKRYIKNMNPPHLIGFHFIRDSKRKFDFINAVHILADLFVVHGIIEDDDIDNFIPRCVPIDGNFYTIDRDNPGVWIYF